ncbi:MAG: HNH endonuclease signature motif containing protein [Rhizonema sp. PD37]|nr:HNH endonuclease signature motif containing protein [Rhizonema sp. PD37]
MVARAKGCCEYCYIQVKFATQSFSLEHILPRYKGGETSLENLALSCQGCNNHLKKDRNVWKPCDFSPRRKNERSID